MEYSIRFINHASVAISHHHINLLCDPWFKGDAFHKGWNLIVENDDDDVLDLLSSITHIWLSHEHPDHFSVGFFLKYKELLVEQGIPVLFQKTEDRRVKSFLEGNGIVVIELPFGERMRLDDGFAVTCIKDGFYDSGLLIEAGATKILNLNDCDVTTAERAREVLKVTGTVDVLLTQFSYAAWKGGRENRSWRKEAARQKLDTVDMQVRIFEPRYLIPFASFVYFSNERNAYLNDSINRPDDVIARLAGSGTRAVVMKPMDLFDGTFDHTSASEALSFWRECYDALPSRPLNRYRPVDMDELGPAYEDYVARVMQRNTGYLMRVARWIAPIKVFRPVVIALDDLDRRVMLDLFSPRLKETERAPHLCMSSESLLFLMKNSFGFDTLTVNGCFEEGQPGGFVTATKTLAIENLNNLGIFFSLKLMVNVQLIRLFLGRLVRVSRKLG